MLSQSLSDRVTDAAVLAYLQEILGIAPSVLAWPGAAKLPYFLQDAFDVRELSFLDHRVLLAIEKRTDKPGLANVRGQVDKLRQVAGMPVLYVTRTLASYERKRLVEQKVPFLVPGNQLYLPDLGIDMREYFRKPAAVPQSALSPATQAMLIAVLLRQPWSAEWQLAAVARDLDYTYTAMTLSRAVKELTAAGIAELSTKGRARWLLAAGNAAETWERAKPMLRSPVKRRVWVGPDPKRIPFRLRLAGLSALARHSMLSDPPFPSYAAGPGDWRLAKLVRVETLPEPIPGASEWEIWHYSPALVSSSETVDPLSLTLSLQGNPDERVQLALDELKARFPW